MIQEKNLNAASGLLMLVLIPLAQLGSVGWIIVAESRHNGWQILFAILAIIVIFIAWERDPVTMACLPTEADFLIRDATRPTQEVRDGQTFLDIRRRWSEQRHYRGRGWTRLLKNSKAQRRGW